MSDGKFAPEDLYAFLEDMGRKGWLHETTAKAMASASRRLFSVLDQDEPVDLSTIDPDDLTERFKNKTKNVSAQTAETYKKRLVTALEYYKSYKADPQWKPPTRQPKRTPTAKKATTRSRDARPYNETPQDASESMSTRSASPAEGFATYFPLRDNIIVKISGLPKNLKTAEAIRMAAFIKTLAVDYSPTDADTKSVASKAEKK